MKETTRKQLYHPLSPLMLYSHIAKSRLIMKDSSGLSFMTWPDGSPCLLANLYMLSLRERPGRGGNGLSRKGSRGGSIGTYASKISPIIRYCFEKKLDFIKLNDDFFSDLINTLRSEKSSANPAIPQRSETSLLAIGRTTLDFLKFVGDFHGDEKFVSPHGSIKAVYKTYTAKGTTGRTIKQNYLHHHTFPKGGRRIHQRNPITANNVKKLRDAVNTINSSRHLQLRRNLMITLLEHTGARRMEISNITTVDILSALNTSPPMLKLETLKQGTVSERLIPITKIVLNEAKKYMDFARTKSIRRLKSAPHHFLFVQEQTGKRLSEHSITNEISILRKHAKIQEQVCPHMFRHAFITNLFTLLIKQHKIQNTDQFRNALLSSKQFIAEVMMWTGHKNPASVERYIHIAFARLDGLEKIVSISHMVRIERIYEQAEYDLLEKLKSGLSVLEYSSELNMLKKLKNEDLADAQAYTGSISL